MTNFEFGPLRGLKMRGLIWIRFWHLPWGLELRGWRPRILRAKR